MSCFEPTHAPLSAHSPEQAACALNSDALQGALRNQLHSGSVNCTVSRGERFFGESEGDPVGFSYDLLLL